MIYFPRVLRRSMHRLLERSPPHSPGCQEMWSYVFCSRDSVLLWCLKNHRNCRRWNREYFKRLGVRIEDGEVKGIMRRFGGRGRELKSWMRELEIWLQEK